MFDKMERISSALSGMSVALREHMKENQKRGADEEY